MTARGIEHASPLLVVCFAPALTLALPSGDGAAEIVQAHVLVPHALSHHFPPARPPPG